MTVRSVALSWCGAGTPGLEAGVPDGVNAGLPVCAIAGRTMASDNSEAAVNSRSMGLLLEGLLASQRQHVGDQRVLLFLGQLEAEHQVEEFDSVGERQQAAVVEVRRRILCRGRSKFRPLRRHKMQAPSTDGSKGQKALNTCAI